MISNLSSVALTKHQSQKHPCQPAKYCYRITNRSLSFGSDHYSITTTPSLQEHVRNSLNNGLRTRISAEEHCEQRSSSVYSMAHCKGLSGHTPFNLHLYRKHADIWHDMNDSATYRKTIICSTGNEALALLKPAAESFFICFYKSAFLRLSPAPNAPEKHSQTELRGRLSRSNNVDCDR